MKRSMKIAVGIIALSALAFASCQKKADAPAAMEKKAAFHIGVVTGTVSQSEDDLRGAEELIKRYGKATEGGLIQHVTYPDNFMDQQGISSLRDFAFFARPKMSYLILLPFNAKKVM